MLKTRVSSMYLSIRSGKHHALSLRNLIMESKQKLALTINCRHKEIQFTFSRTTNANSIHYIDEPCYHYSYVLSDQEVKKNKTWAHSNDFIIRNLWYQIKWKRWHQSSQYLHPGSPWLWRRAMISASTTSFCKSTA